MLTGSFHDSIDIHGEPVFFAKSHVITVISMNLLIEFLTDSGQFIRPWLSEISTAMVACLLVVFGADINRALRRQLSGTNFIIRTLVFILVNAFGYGFLIVSVSPWLAKQLSHIPSQWLICLVVSIFIFVGSWAQRNRQV